MTKTDGNDLVIMDEIIKKVDKAIVNKICSLENSDKILEQYRSNFIKIVFKISDAVCLSNESVKDIESCITEGFQCFPALEQNQWDYLIIGKAPAKDTIDYCNKHDGQYAYFLNPTNKFWQIWSGANDIVEAIQTGEGYDSLSTLQSKFLSTNGIVLRDRTHVFFSKDKRSSDEKRIAIAYNDILSFLNKRKEKKNKYATIILLGKSEGSKDECELDFINFIDKGLSYEVSKIIIEQDGKNVELDENSVKKGSDILKRLIKDKQRLLVKIGKKKVWIVACIDTSRNTRKDLYHTVEDRKRSGLQILADVKNQKNKK